MSLTLPDGITGAVLAALIAAIASLLGLIIAKEQKVSELRQAWIDALREDLANLIACGSEVAFNPYQFEGSAEARARNTLVVQEANLRTYRTKLRLNIKEPESKLLSDAIDHLRSLAQKNPHPTELEMDAAEDDLVIKAQTVLKLEWERVKKGESGFRGLRISLFVALSILSILFAASIFAAKPKPSIAQPIPAEVLINLSAQHGMPDPASRASGGAGKSPAATSSADCSGTAACGGLNRAAERAPTSANDARQPQPGAPPRGP